MGVHFPTGEEVPDDVVEAGVWLYPEGYVPELEGLRAERASGQTNS